MAVLAVGVAVPSQSIAVTVAVAPRSPVVGIKITTYESERPRRRSPGLGNVSHETSRSASLVRQRAFFVNHSPLYWERRRKPAMAINGRRNKPFGPGGGTRRLHPSPARPGLGGGETGSTRA